jgi:DNA-binding NarL/FixJ family response regulator
MSLRHRPMRPKDVRECADLVASHPVIGPRYGHASADLRLAWLRLLEFEAKSAVVFEEVEGAHSRIWGVGVSVFVHDGFVQELKRPQLFWIGPELVRRVLSPEPPLLSNQRMRESNTSGGMNLLVWEGVIHPEDANRAEIYNKMMSAFMEEHRGYLWKEIIGSQAESAERFQSMIKSGGMLWKAEDGYWLDSLTTLPQEIINQPHVIGLTRNVEKRRPGSWVGTLFDYNPPQFGFSVSEQRLLISALRGGTDEQLSDELGISLSAVKKTWRAIYDRVAARSGELTLAKSNDGAAERGKEKKQRLVAYLRDHPEELRPVSRKLLQQGAVQGASGRA